MYITYVYLCNICSLQVLLRVQVATCKKPAAAAHDVHAAGPMQGAERARQEPDAPDFAAAGPGKGLGFGASCLGFRALGFPEGLDFEASYVLILAMQQTLMVPLMLMVLPMLAWLLFLPRRLLLLC